MFQALTVQKEGSEIRLISGERRFTSLKYLTDTGKTYTYNGADITGYAPVSYVKQAVGDMKTMMMFSANAPRPLPIPVEITADVTPTSFTPSTLRNLSFISPIAVSSFELSKRVRPILSDVVAPILALTVWFE